MPRVAAISAILAGLVGCSLGSAFDTPGAVVDAPGPVVDAPGPDSSAGSDAGRPALATPCPVTAPFAGFVKRVGGKLYDGARELRFASVNVPGLFLAEDPSWHLPSAWEQEDALCSVVQMGGQVVRTYVISVGDSRPDRPRHVTAPGVLDGATFVALDQALALANRYGVRVIIPLVDQWSWWGGITEWGAFAGKPADAFFTDGAIIAGFEDTVRKILDRTNTVTGVRYRDDRAILGWETGNELSAPPAWTRRIAATIRASDPDHLIIDGHYGVVAASLADPNIDIVTNHYYPGPAVSLRDRIGADLAAVAGRRPFLVGELGLVPAAELVAGIDAAVQGGALGALLWSLRPHDDQGGFLWHREGDGSYQAYHWPGFLADERALFAGLRRAAFAIRGEALAALQPPVAPVLLAADDASSIRFRGATGAAIYRLERAAAADGPFAAVGRFDDAREPNRAIASDPTATPGATTYYRLVAENEVGESPPSNVLGPVPAR